MNKRIVFGTIVTVALLLTAMPLSANGEIEQTVDDLLNIPIIPSQKEMQQPNQQQQARAREALPVSEDHFQVAQLRDGTLAITGYTGPYGGDITIPSKLFGIAVSEIRGFSGSFNSITIENGIKRIGGGAFSDSYGGNVNVKYVQLPDTVIEIGEWAFSNSKLEYINLPNSLKEIAKETFSKTKLEYISLPDSLEKIGKSAFEDCENLKEIIIPKNVKRIEDYAFRGCSNASLIVIPPSVVYLGMSAVMSSSTVKHEIYWLTEKLTFSGGGKGCEKITIIANLNLTGDNDFSNYYVSQGRKAGTYVKNGPLWTYSGPAQILLNPHPYLHPYLKLSSQILIQIVIAGVVMKVVNKEEFIHIETLITKARRKKQW